MNPENLLGKILADDVITNSGVVLVGRGSRIVSEHLESFQTFGIDLEDIKILDETTSLDTPSDQDAKLDLERIVMVEEVQSQIEDFVDLILKKDEVPVDQLENKIIPSLDDICAETNFYAILATLKQEGHYLYHHSLGVSILANYMAKWLNWSDEDSRVLVTSALVYDIGMMMLPKDLVNKKQMYTLAEMKHVQKHTELGYELLSKTPGIDPRIPKVALQHHERMDGSGYPNRLTKDDIIVEARIIGMLDVFVAMTSNRTYRAAHPVNIVLQMMQLEIAQLFDKTYSVPFLHHMMQSQVGKEVLLSDRTKGTIMYVSPTEPLRPLIHKKSGEWINLQERNEIHIHAILG